MYTYFCYSFNFNKIIVEYSATIDILLSGFSEQLNSALDCRIKCIRI